MSSAKPTEVCDFRERDEILRLSLNTPVPQPAAAALCTAQRLHALILLVFFTHDFKNFLVRGLQCTLTQFLTGYVMDDPFPNPYSILCQARNRFGEDPTLFTI